MNAIIEIAEYNGDNGQNDQQNQLEFYGIISAAAVCAFLKVECVQHASPLSCERNQRRKQRAAYYDRQIEVLQPGVKIHVRICKPAFLCAHRTFDKAYNRADCQHAQRVLRTQHIACSKGNRHKDNFKRHPLDR